ncbi:MAG: hypothetical protein QM564_02500 [Bergeyella sp.]
MKKVICVDTGNPENWVLVDEKDHLKVGEVYTISETISDEETGETYYRLVEKPKRDWKHVMYNSKRFIDVPENGEIPKIEPKPEIPLTLEQRRENFIRKMKYLGIDDEGIQNNLDICDEYGISYS